jgi:putative mRNA 3-end processing factor
LSDLVTVRPEGLYCERGDFYIDPWRPVERAVLTHAHGDHAHAGHRRYLAAAPGAEIVRQRLGDIALDTLAYGEQRDCNGVRIALFPAGHILGSAQVRIEHRGEVWVVSGDYKVQPDATCSAFEPVRCDVFITESTFGLPIYRWPPAAEVFASIQQWWSANAAAGRPSVLFCYALGKAQRILNALDPSTGAIVCQGAIEPINALYARQGIALAQATPLATLDRNALRQALILAPPSARRSPWMKRFAGHSDAFASGWMQLRGPRRRRGVDRGFVLSDHADWPGLLDAIAASGARRVLATHGSVHSLVRWLREQGLEAAALATEYGDDESEAVEENVPRDELP